jgi:putative sigma-54 modulation protein
MVDIKISGRKVSVTDAMRDRVNEKIGESLKVFDIKPMSCDVVLRVDKNRSNPDRQTAEVTVFMRDNVVRVEASDTDMYVAIDTAAEKVTRQLRKYKTRVIDHKHHSQRENVRIPGEAVTDLADLINGDDDDALVREKFIELHPMTEEEALVQTDLIGHDFYVFENATTGLVNVIYHRHNGGYGIIKPRIESEDDE